MPKNTKNLLKKICYVHKIFSIFCLISNTLPQLEPASLELSSVIHHRHRLQTICYNHLLLLLLLLNSSKENRSRSRLSRGLRSQKGLRPLQPTAVNCTHNRPFPLKDALISGNLKIANEEKEKFTKVLRFVLVVD